MTPRSPALDPRPGDVLFVAGTKLAVTWCEDCWVGYKKHGRKRNCTLDEWRELCRDAMVLENADLKGAKP